MAKKKASDISGWIFIGIGFVVISVSIFFYDTLKFFIVIGGIMTIYGLGKLAYDKVEKQFILKEEEWGPVDLNKAKNPYIETMEQEKRNAAAQTSRQISQPQQQQQHMQQQRAVAQHQQRQMVHGQQQHSEHMQHQQRGQQRVQHSQHPSHLTQQHTLRQAPLSGRYCASCGSQIAPHHRFCTQCGARVN